MYVCMHECMYVCMHACMDVSMSVCMYAWMYGCMDFTFVCIKLYKFAHGQLTDIVRSPQESYWDTALSSAAMDLINFHGSAIAMMVYIDIYDIYMTFRTYLYDI